MRVEEVFAGELFGKKCSPHPLKSFRTKGKEKRVVHCAVPSEQIRKGLCSMKHKKAFFRVLEYLQRNVNDYICLTACCVLFFVFYWNVSGAMAAEILIAICLFYVAVMALSAIGLAKITQHERHCTLTHRRAVGYSFLVSSPIYFSWMLVSVIPVLQYEVWLLIGFPICVISFLTMTTIAKRWKKGKAWFWIIQIGIYLAIFVSGQVITHAVFA